MRQQWANSKVVTPSSESVARKGATSQPTMATMYKCRLCKGEKRVGAGWVASGDICKACDGQGKLPKPQHECLLCNAKGHMDSGFFGQKECVACKGLCYLTKKQHACKRCMAKGTQATGSIGLWSTMCTACHGSRYVNAKQKECRKCKGGGQMPSGLFGLFKRSCVACEGVGLVEFPQHRCRRCVASGSVGPGITCPLCDGKCFTTQYHLKCPKCGGNGIQSGFFSSEECRHCARKGYTFIKRSETQGLFNADDSDSDSDDYDDDDDTSDDVERAPSRQASRAHKHRRTSTKSGKVASTKRGLCKQIGIPFGIMALFIVYYVWRSGLLGFFADTSS
eukprot:m.122779 g.122779  ORF g.122779 m.122779 type:complete len:336 (+) comp28941_c0_seq4:395-1402(+)